MLVVFDSDNRCVKLKLSNDRPGQALRASGVEDPRISRQWVHEGGKVIIPTPAAFTLQEILLVLISVRG
jgi:hypothetical protein